MAQMVQVPGSRFSLRLPEIIKYTPSVWAMKDGVDRLGALYGIAHRTCPRTFAKAIPALRWSKRELLSSRLRQQFRWRFHETADDSGQMVVVDGQQPSGLLQDRRGAVVLSIEVQL